MIEETSKHGPDMIHHAHEQSEFKDDDNNGGYMMQLYNHSDMMELINNSEIEYNDAQQNCLRFFRSLYSNTREVCCEMPTGTGKSFMILDRLNTQNPKTNRCVIVFPRLTLLIQFRCAYLKKEVPLFYCSANDIDSSDELQHEEENALATIEKEKNRNDRKINKNIILTTYVSFPKLVDDPNYPNIKLTLFDEAHHCDGQRMKDLLMDPQKKEKCGTIYHFTATPVQINTMNTTNGSHFVYTFEEAIRNHLIRSYKVHVVFHLKTSEEDDVNSNTVLDEIAKINGDKFQRILAFTGYTQHESLPTNRHNVTDIVPEWNDPNKGYNVVGLSSDNPSIDRYTIKRFEEFNEGKLSVLVSCRKLGEGIDIKGINSVMFVDPRKKKKDIYQIIGRGLRLFRDSTGKPLDWSQQTPCNIILDIAIDPPSHPYLRYLKTGDFSHIANSCPDLQALAYLSQIKRIPLRYVENVKKKSEEQYRVDCQRKLFDDLSNQIDIRKSSFGIFESIVNTITALKVNMPCDQRHQLDLKYECLDAKCSKYSAISKGKNCLISLEGIVDKIIQFTNESRNTPSTYSTVPYRLCKNVYIQLGPIWRYIKYFCPELRDRCIKESAILETSIMFAEDGDPLIDPDGMGIDEMKIKSLETNVLESIRNCNELIIKEYDKDLKKHRNVNVILDQSLNTIFKGSKALDEMFKVLNGLNVEKIMDDNNKETTNKKNKKRSLESSESFCSSVTDDTSNGNMKGMKKQKTLQKHKNNKKTEERKV